MHRQVTERGGGWRVTKTDTHAVRDAQIALTQHTHILTYLVHTAHREIRSDQNFQLDLHTNRNGF